MSDAPDYDAIEARTNAATVGPWLIDAGVDGAGWVFVGNRSDGRDFGLWEIVHSSSDPLRDLTPKAAQREVADAEFIAHARTDVPALIARCRELEAKVAAVRVEAASALAHPDPYLWQVGHAIEAILDSTGDPTP